MTFRSTLAVVALAIVPAICCAQDIPNRKELKRADLSGTGMEVIISISEYKPGETIYRHSHHGEEAFYILEGAQAELPNGSKTEFIPGTANINVRDVVHGGVKIVGDKTLKLLNVHIVDKGKLLYEPPK